MAKRIISKIVYILLAAFFSLCSGYFILTRTEKGQELFHKEQAIQIKLDEKADLSYVKEENVKIREDITELKTDVNDDMDRMIDNMNQRFDDQNHTLDKVIELLKE